MKRRKPILDFQNPRDPPPNVPRTANEIPSLVCYSEDSDTETSFNSSKASIPSTEQIDPHGAKPTTPWQACVDENTRYSYFWNMETNQVTWEVPPDYSEYLTQVKQWTAQQAANNARYEELSEIQQQSEKNKNAKNERHSTSDSDSSNKDEKIELISTYGPSSDDDSGSEKKNSDKKSQNYKAGKLFTSLSDDKFSKPSANNLHTSTITSNQSNTGCASVKNESSETTSQAVKQKEVNGSFKPPSNSLFPSQKENTSNENISKLNKVLDCTNSDENSSDDEDEDDEELDDVIISRLRKKATLLKQLGGEVPKEIMSVFDNSKTAEDIIAEIEKEIPADSNEMITIPSEPKPPEIPNKDIKPADTPTPKPLFPILDYMKKEDPVEVKPLVKSFTNQKNKMKNVQKIKLSARAKELIRTSLLTAKARATNFVETEDGLKPAEEVQKLKNEAAAAADTITNDDMVIDDPEDAEIARKSDILSKLKSDSIEEAGSTAGSVIENLESKKSAASANYFNLPDKPTEDKKGFGFATKIEEKTIPKSSDVKIVKNDSSSNGKYDFQTSFMVYTPKQKKSDDAKKTDDKTASLWSKCEEFLKTEINRPDDMPKKKTDDVQKIDDNSKRKSKKSKENAFNDIDIDEVLNTKGDSEEKKMTDLSQLIMEKLKFLSDGKGAVAPVQVMAIQIETLVGAWQSGALTLKYLSDWLEASVAQLKSIEEAAAPNGWHCEWDRSYGRYYYRNKVTGSIQWDFPDNDESSKSCKSSRRSSSKRSGHSRLRTPPPPTISRMVAPPPPVISDQDSRRRRLSPRRDSSKRRRDDDRYDDRYRSSKSRHRYSPPTPVLPPLPSAPPKPSTPPPPPPPPPSCSPPPPPPPPPVISSTVEFGSKLSEINYADECTTATPMELEEDEKPVKLHDELDSFYSDIATIEATFTLDNKVEQQTLKTEEVSARQPEKTLKVEKPAKTEEKVVKKKRKVKLDAGLSLKKKGLEGLVAKWQKVNSDI